MSELGSILHNHMKHKLAVGEAIDSMTVHLARSIEIAAIDRGTRLVRS